MAPSRPRPPDANASSSPSAFSSVLGQLSYAPATQTTVVTTTTTTTTNFPPLIMRAPNQSNELDPKLYPLADTPTPASIKKFRFNVGGHSTFFQEADDTGEALREIQEQNDALKASNGLLRSISSSHTAPHTPRVQTPVSTPIVDKQTRQARHAAVEDSRWSTRPATENKTFFESQGPQRSHTKELQRKYAEPRGTRSSRLQALQNSTPITPLSETSSSLDSHARLQRQREHSSLHNFSVITPEMETVEFSQTLSPQPERNLDRHHDSHGGNIADTGLTYGSASNIEDGLRKGPSNARSRPSALDTNTAQDASLPSPSLSPVTAAASLHNRKGYFDDSAPSSQQEEMRDRLRRVYSFESGQYDSQQDELEPPASGEFSLMNIPLLLDSFEAMPAEMKTYVMYQLLRRCPKPVLQFVAENVNPALKCDFLNHLPPELSQNIIRHLDLKSLCRASQVSKKWRQVIDTDERIWKDLFDAEGFDLPTPELQRAISEGWGWQFDSDSNGWERDISSGSGRSGSAGLSSPIAMDTGSDSVLPLEVNSPGQARRPKRKAVQKTRAASRKQTKRAASVSNEIALFDTESLRRHLEEADGPYAAAQAALLAVPSPQLGLSSLRNMHLHKSIYRRHHLVSRNWMQDEIKPRHLAFKAHQRHVVTCLQFDADKILTGSDDTNINVYDTRTGTLRARLEGHEGGVWALQYEGSTLVSGSTDRSVRVWDIDKGVCKHVFLGHTSTVRCLIILMPTKVGKMPNGRPIIMPKEPIIVTGSRDSTLRVWKLPKPNDPSTIQTPPLQEDAESPYFVRALTGHTHSVRAIAAHGDTLVSGSYDSTVRVWRISTGETIHRLSGHTSKVYSVVLDYERNRCISGSMDNLVKIWSLETGTLLFNLEGHSSLVGLLDLQRDRLVSAAADSTLRIWDPDSGQSKNVLSAHTGAITCFQHDGRKVISGADRNLKMWNVQTGEFVRDLLTDLSGVWQVKFDERRCVAAVQRKGLTYIEVLDFGSSRDGLPTSKRGKRTVVDVHGMEIHESSGEMLSEEDVVSDA